MGNRQLCLLFVCSMLPEPNRKEQIGVYKEIWIFIASGYERQNITKRTDRTWSNGQ
jgi:hypothetical protein